MKIVFAFDSFKGSVSASDACRAGAMAIKSVYPDAQVVEIPMSDGGEGLVSCVSRMLEVNTIVVDAHGPLMEPVKAEHAVSKDGQTAYMEMAATSGLPMVPIDKRNPLLTTTYGVGDMICNAINSGVKHIIMGIGGSATCDGGKGMIQCLMDRGYLDKTGKIVNNKLLDCKFLVASDVNNPLYGPQGAAYIFGPQKGATPDQVLILDEQLKAFAYDSEKAGIATPDLANYPGAGAAGGLGYALMAYLKAELRSGIDIILDITNFDTLIENATLIVTGEGKSDEQTLMGKVPHGVLRRAKKKNIPVWLLSGSIVDTENVMATNFSLVKSINEGDNRPLEVLMQESVAKQNIAKTIVKLCNDIK